MVPEQCSLRKSLDHRLAMVARKLILLQQEFSYNWENTLGATFESSQVWPDISVVKELMLK